MKTKYRAHTSHINMGRLGTPLCTNQQEHISNQILPVSIT